MPILLLILFRQSDKLADCCALQLQRPLHFFSAEPTCASMETLASAYSRGTRQCKGSLPWRQAVSRETRLCAHLWSRMWAYPLDRVVWWIFCARSCRRKFCFSTYHLMGSESSSRCASLWFMSECVLLPDDTWIGSVVKGVALDWAQGMRRWRWWPHKKCTNGEKPDHLRASCLGTFQR